MNGFNIKRVLLGGLAAGAFINVIEFIVHGFVLQGRYMELMKMGYYYPEPIIPFMVVHPITMLCVGFLLAWVYAAARKTLSPGPWAALQIGLVLGFLAALPSGIVTLAWSPVGILVPILTALAFFVEFVGGTVIAAAIYKD